MTQEEKAKEFFNSKTNLSQGISISMEQLIVKLISEFSSNQDVNWAKKYSQLEAAFRELVFDNFHKSVTAKDWLHRAGLKLEEEIT